MRGHEFQGRKNSPEEFGAFLFISEEGYIRVNPLNKKASAIRKRQGIGTYGGVGGAFVSRGFQRLGQGPAEHDHGREQTS